MCVKQYIHRSYHSFVHNYLLVYSIYHINRFVQKYQLFSSNRKEILIKDFIYVLY